MNRSNVIDVIVGEHLGIGYRITGYLNEIGNHLRHSFDDQPAYVEGNIKEWYEDGKIHRIGAPAIIKYENGIVTQLYYFKYDSMHRDDGPAEFDFRYAKIYFWINGEDITEKVEEWISSTGRCHPDKWSDSDRLLFKLTFG